MRFSKLVKQPGMQQACYDNVLFILLALVRTTVMHETTCSVEDALD